jgi:hypothetical protein
MANQSREWSPDAEDFARHEAIGPLVEALREAAGRLAGDDVVEVRHVEETLQQWENLLGVPLENPRLRAEEEIRSIITRAALGNRIIEVCAFIATVLLFVLGISLLGLSIWLPVDAAVCAGLLALLLIPLRLAVWSRRHRFAIQLLGQLMVEHRGEERLALIRELLRTMASDSSFASDQ